MPSTRSIVFLLIAWSLGSSVIAQSDSIKVAVTDLQKAVKDQMICDSLRQEDDHAIHVLKRNLSEVSADRDTCFRQFDQEKASRAACNRTVEELKNASVWTIPILNWRLGKGGIFFSGLGAGILTTMILRR